MASRPLQKPQSLVISYGEAYCTSLIQEMISQAGRAAYILRIFHWQYSGNILFRPKAISYNPKFTARQGLQMLGSFSDRALLHKKIFSRYTRSYWDIPCWRGLRCNKVRAHLPGPTSPLFKMPLLRLQHAE